jgi:aminoglycoside phosphotransferase (APT) family kinase protein
VPIVTWADRSRAHRQTTPSTEGLARLSERLGEQIALGEQLHGGVATATHALRTPTRALVLKRYQDEDTTAELEWDRLHVALGADVPTPAPVALDLDGAWFGCQALVMTRLPGGVVYPPPVEALAATLAAIHAMPVPEPLPPVLLRPAMWATWEPEIELVPAHLHALAALRAHATGQPLVVTHSDYHPGNVLVSDGAVTGVIDWASARLAPRQLDVALMRGDLSVEPGGDAPNRFAAAYERASGVSLPHLELWDLLAAARILEDGDGWVDAWTDAGVPMTVERIRAAAEAFRDDALSRL